MPIVNPETQRKSRTFTHAGKRDGVIQAVLNTDETVTPPTYLLEHKTTSEDISDPTASFWKRLVIDSQVSAYVLSHWQAGQKLDGTLYDVLVRPAIRPKHIPAKSKEVLGSQVEMVENGTYYGNAVTFQQCAEEETPYLFSLRVAYETVNDPNRYFQRRVIPRMDSDIIEFAHELWQIADEIRLCEKSGRWFRNSSACMTYGRPCEFLPLCSGEDTSQSDQWRVRPKLHSELSDESQNALTNSSMKCFQTCRRLYYNRYELGIQRAREEDSEALQFGTLIHLALNAWWGAKSTESENQNASTDNA